MYNFDLRCTTDLGCVCWNCTWNLCVETLLKMWVLKLYLKYVRVDKLTRNFKLIQNKKFTEKIIKIAKKKKSHQLFNPIFWQLFVKSWNCWDIDFASNSSKKPFSSLLLCDVVCVFCEVCVLKFALEMCVLKLYLKCGCWNCSWNVSVEIVLEMCVCVCVMCYVRVQINSCTP